MIDSNENSHKRNLYHDEIMANFKSFIDQVLSTCAVATDVMNSITMLPEPKLPTV